MGHFAIWGNNLSRQRKWIYQRTGRGEMKADELIQQHHFTSEEWQEVLTNKKLLFPFAVANMLKMHPEMLINKISLDVWAAMERSGAITQDDYEVVGKQTMGGECDECGKAWKKREFSIKEVDKEGNEKRIVITYQYEPACDCYGRCMICRSWLIAEKKNGDKICRVCSVYGTKRKIISCMREYPRTGSVGGKKKQLPGRWEMCGGEMSIVDCKNGFTIYLCNKCQKKFSYKPGHGLRKVKES